MKHPEALKEKSNARQLLRRRKQWQQREKSESDLRAMTTTSSTRRRRTDAQVSGPVPLPTEKEVVTVLRAVHKYKDSREQFEQRTHKRLIDIIRPSAKTVEALTGLELPAGVDIEIKL